MVYLFIDKANQSNEDYFIGDVPPIKLVETRNIYNMKLLTKESLKRANFDSQKKSKDNSNVITDIYFVTGRINCIKNSVTDTASRIIIFFWKNDMLYELQALTI